MSPSIPPIESAEEIVAFLEVEGPEACLPTDQEDRDDQSIKQGRFGPGTSGACWVLVIVLALVGAVLLPYLNEAIAQNGVVESQEENLGDLFDDKFSQEKGTGHLEKCIWQPNAVTHYTNTSCFNLVSERILASYRPVIDKTGLPPLRWLLFGDSTMFRLFGTGALNGNLLKASEIQQACDQLLCYQRSHSRCSLNEAYLFPPLLTDLDSSWRMPNFTLGEGPSMYGLETHNCQDCGGCNSRYVICNRKAYATTQECNLNDRNSTTRRTMYGGYFSIEFARDVEVQTAKFSTTQENVAHIIQENFNQELWLLEHFGGRPICVVCAGIHDIYLPEITLSKFLNNVEWYLELLLEKACGHVVWILNTAPLNKDANDTAGGPYPQNQVNMQEWNEGVYKWLNATERLPRNRITVIDAFEASRNFPHEDNIHLAGAWYNTLGAFFQQTAQNIVGNPKCSESGITSRKQVEEMHQLELYCKGKQK
jgi:hypothetical protein